MAADHWLLDARTAQNDARANVGWPTICKLVGDAVRRIWYKKDDQTRADMRFLV
jgi:hypothetical protein